MSSSHRHMLVVGNGFDLAHGLPTRYQDMLNQLFSDDTPWLSDEERQLFRCNPLVRYFRKHQNVEGWTGFEGELRTIINYFCQGYSTTHNDADLYQDSIEQAFDLKFRECWRKKQYRELWQSLRQHLNELIEYIDLYLTKYIPSRMPKELSNTTQYPHFIYGRQYDYFLSFNYTNTYFNFAQMIHSGSGIAVPTEDHFIHGRCSIDGDPQNIVLGIEDDNPSNLDTIYFEKYFQRIQKKTGREVFDWFDQEITPGDPIVTDIFGHSLDTTDKDILMLIFEKSQHTNIYYYNQSDYESKIINLVKLYGSPDEFTKRYYNHQIRLYNGIIEYFMS